MDATTTTAVAGLPALTPAQVQLMDLLGSGTIPDERNAAREMSISVPEVRSMIGTLCDQLGLPRSESHEKAFSRLKERAEERAQALQEIAKQVRSKNGAGALEKLFASPEWQQKLAKVAAAIAKGVHISVDPYKIRPMHGQPRDYFPEEEQDSLGNSLGLVGQIQDLIIRKKPPPRQATPAGNFGSDDERMWRIADTEYEICDGERRWRGAMDKKVLEVRAKLIEIDDEGAYLVAIVSNFNRVAHTTLERARSIERLMNGDPPFPIEVVAALQGMSVPTARKLLDTLKLPPEIREMMDPRVMRKRGQDVLGKVPSYELARLAGKPEFHDKAHDLANRYVNRELRLPQLRVEVDQIFARGKSGERGQRWEPARLVRNAGEALDVTASAMRHTLARLKTLKQEGSLPEKARALGETLNLVIDLAEEALTVVGAKRKRALANGKQ